MKSPKDQRLIFSGKLLDDSMVLNQVFIKVCFFPLSLSLVCVIRYVSSYVLFQPTSGSSFMIHLVLSSDKHMTVSFSSSCFSMGDFHRIFRHLKPLNQQRNEHVHQFQNKFHRRLFRQVLPHIQVLMNSISKN